jgi:hypothetical protein
MEKEILVALITSGGAIAASTIAAGAVLFAAKRVVDRKDAVAGHVRAMKDVEFLLKVEQAYIDMNVTANGKCSKVMVRDVVRAETGLDLSGKNTLSAIRRRLARYGELDK